MTRPTRILGALSAAALSTVLTAGALVAPTATAAPAAPATEAAGPRAFGVTEGGSLLTFALRDPRDVTRIGPLRGFSQDDTEVVGIDVRPATGRLYAVGDAGGVYVVRVRDARLVRVGEVAFGGPITGGGLEGRRFGVDFNPAADALRIVSDTGQNLRVTFDGRDVAQTFQDTPLNDGAGERVEGVTAAAYTNNDRSEETGTALLDINTASNGLFLQAPANAGSLSPVGQLRVGVGPDASFDIRTGVDRRGVATGNAGWAVLQQRGNRILFRIDLGTGKATRVGAFAPRAQVADIAVR